MNPWHHIPGEPVPWPEWLPKDDLNIALLAFVVCILPPIVLYLIERHRRD